MTRRNRDADNLSTRLDRAADVIPSVEDHLNEQRALVGGITSRSDGGRQRGTHSDPTGSALAKLADLDIKRQAIVDALGSINVGVRLLEEACADALRTRARPAERSEPSAGEPTCAGGDPSTWGDPTCGELVNWTLGDNGHVSHDRDKLCLRHRQAFDEWTRMDADERRRAEESNARRARRHRQADDAQRASSPIRSVGPPAA